MKSILVTASIGVAVAVTGCMSGLPDQSDLDSRPEAREWLKANRNPSALASNRFGPSSSAARFVDRLYAAGATKVVIDNVYDEPDRIKDEGGPYADTLLVQLPEDRNVRSAIFRIHDEESRKEGFDPTPDSGQSILMFWWD